MAILTKGGTPSKGSSTSFTLNITDLLAHASVSGDAYFSVQSNWDKVFLNYTSSIGGQKDFVIFKAVDSGTSDVADFSVVAEARDVFEIKSLIILDKQGGTLEIPRASLVTAEFDVIFV